jgi:hypothetical protein
MRKGLRILPLGNPNRRVSATRSSATSSNRFWLIRTNAVTERLARALPTKRAREPVTDALRRSRYSRWRKQVSHPAIASTSICLYLP